MSQAGSSSKPIAPRRALPRRWWMFRLSELLISCIPYKKQKNGVLILRMFGIGDALIFRTVLEKYAEALGVPLSGITILGSAAWCAAVPFFNGVNIELIDERRFARRLFYRLKIMLRLRRRGFKTAICGMRFRQPHVIDALMLASGADERIVVEPRPDEKFNAMFAHYLPLMTRIVSAPEADKPRDTNGQPLPLTHEIEHQLAFLSAVAGRAITLDALPKLDLPAGLPSLVKAGARYVVINVGASHGPRRWPLDSVCEIARRFMAQGITVVLLGGPSEASLKKEIELKASEVAGQGGRLITAINTLDFMDAARLLNHAAIFVSSDTGLGHLALMARIPSVLIVGGGHFGSFMPYPKHLMQPRICFLYHPMPCYHCNWNCTMMPPGGTTFPCVQEVSVVQVWQAIQEIMPPELHGVT